MLTPVGESFKMKWEGEAGAKLYSFVGLESSLGFILKIMRKDWVALAKEVA